MELKVKYQYTYFIKPFLIKENKYGKYLLSLLNNKNYKLKIFEKEKDYNLYSYFMQNVREYFFPTFLLSKDKIKELNKTSKSIKATILSKFHCNIFEYNIDKNIQGKINDESNIFFNIEKIEIVCFDTGICFLVIKTNMENAEKFSDLLNFNYKFKDINSEGAKLKEFDNIKIQTDKFNNMKELSDFIDEITCVNNNLSELKNIDLYNKRFFVYTYACINQENWNKEDDFNNLKNSFFKFSNVLSNDTSIDFNKEEDNTQEIEQFKYAKFGFRKQSCALITSGVDINNYTKLLFDYENKYLYTLIIRLYQRVYLKKIENDFNSKRDINNLRNKFFKFTSEIWLKEITNSNTGTIFYNKWIEVFELEEIYNGLKNKYDFIYKELKIESNNKINKFILIALIISMLLNIINLIILLNFRM